MSRITISLVWVLALASFGAEAPETVGPWRLELVAEAPSVRHPSVVCSAPDGRIFVAEDPMDITAPAQARQGRIVCLHPDGRRTVFAENLHAVFGMQYLEGNLYVLHNPRFDVFTDEGEHGRLADTLIESTNPNPWALDWNDHVPANFKLAMDGFFYLAVGDKGIYGAVGKDGRKVFLHGGGILRLRPDGSGMEVYSTGVRNILDVALTSEDEIFTYDNTDEHDWMGRLTHMVEGGFYGYPHDFVPRRPYTLWMMHDFGGGAATGTIAYTEDALPLEYQDNLFLADFGKRQVTRVVIEREGATFKVARHEDLFAKMPENFRPVGIALTADGKSILICDWQHRDVKGTNEVGRLWKLTFTGEARSQPKPEWYVPLALGKKAAVSDADLARGLEHRSREVRLTSQRELARRKAKNILAEAVAGTNEAARWHAIWGLHTLGDRVPPNAGMTPATLRQAVRLAGGRSFLGHPDAGVRFQAATAMGRERANVEPLLERLTEPDSFARYAVFHALNRIGRADGGAWRKIVEAMARPSISEAASYALRETWDTQLLADLIAFAGVQERPLPARTRALALIAGMTRKSPEWKGEWWAYHPALAPAPRRTEVWPGTASAVNFLKEQIEAPESTIRLAAVRMLAEEPSAAVTLRQRFVRERVRDVRVEILRSLRALRDSAAGPLVGSVLQADLSPLTVEAVRAAEFCPPVQVLAGLRRLFALELDAETRAELIRVLGILREEGDEALIARETKSAEPQVRVAAARALGRVGGETAIRALRTMLKQPALDSKLAAITALGELKDRETVPDLLQAWREPELKQAGLEALLRMPDAGAMEAYLEGLGNSNPRVRESTRRAMESIKAEAWPLVKDKLDDLPPLVIAELNTIYPGQSDLTLVSRTKVVPTTEDYVKFALKEMGDAMRGRDIYFNEAGVACIRCHTVGGQGHAVGPDMTSIGAQFGREALIEHIVLPSKSVREGYQQVQIEMEDDEFFAGLIKGESAEELTILDGQARLHTLPKRKIKSRHQSELSLMPEGLQMGLSLQEFADLIAYLQSLKGQ